MALTETRMVMIEKVERMQVRYILEQIDIEVLAKSQLNRKGAFFYTSWLKNKLVNKVLEQNGYKVFHISGVDRNGYISWK